jgi:hypothetical protein
MHNYTKKILLASALIFCTFITGFSKDYIARKWEVVEMDFTFRGRLEDPFKVNFGVVLTYSTGFSTTIPGFYNGDKTWLIRFCPDLEGVWAYETFSSVAALAGQKGKIRVDSKTKLDEHGPIVVSKDNSQKFAYADGTPYFLMAFELDWLFALDLGNEEGIPNTEKIIDEVDKNEFNHIVMNVYAYDAPWGEKDKIDPKYNFARPSVFPFGGSNDNPDYSTLNIYFFKHLDRVIAHLDQKEIIAHLMIYVWNKEVNWPEPNSEADNLYFDYVAKRYQAFPNLVWDISKEALDYGREDMGHVTNRIDRLRKLDGHGRLLSVHDYNYCDAFPEKVDFISIQEWRPNVYNAMLDVRTKHAKKPVFNIEHGGYEKTMHSIFDGAYNDPLACLDRNYKCIFGGAYSTYYWQNTSWYEVVYDPFSLPEEQQPNFHYYKNIVNLFTAYDFSSLETYQLGFTPMTLTDHKSVYMYYVTKDMLAVTGEAPELRGKTVSIKWFDPLTGLFHDDGRKTFDDSVWLGLRKPAVVTSPICVAVLEIIQ